MKGFLLLLGLGLAWTVVITFVRVIKLRSYHARSSTRQAWLDRFPEIPAEEIDRFLSLVVDAFGFADTWRFRLLPDDKILALYRSCHPGIDPADDMELESLGLSLKEHYGFQLWMILDEQLTLGELLSAVLRHKSASIA